jgi:hypothetical protein
MITYRQFRSLVNREILRQSGMGLDCLADCDISDFWDSQLTDNEAQALAIEAAHMLLADNDFPMDCIQGERS